MYTGPRGMENGLGIDWGGGGGWGRGERWRKKWDNYKCTIIFKNQMEKISSSGRNEVIPETSGKYVEK